jgi:phosphoenolpyruvate carboxykinase (GTP)
LADADAGDACLLVEMVASGTFIKLNQKLRPNSYLARSDVRDVARVESCTFICTDSKDEAGPTNNWAQASEMMEKLQKMFAGAMRGRTLYVIPFLMGPIGSPYSKFGIEITDSPYVVVNMKIMTRMGSSVLHLLTEDTPFLVCVAALHHTVLYSTVVLSQWVLIACQCSDSGCSHASIPLVYHLVLVNKMFLGRAIQSIE